MKKNLAAKFIGVLAVVFSAFVSSSFLYADAGNTDAAATGPNDPTTQSTSGQGSAALGQFPQTEVAPIVPSREAVNGNTSIDFPKVKTSQDEELAKKFTWWPTDAKPAPVKDPNRSGYWWWPEVPGQARPWGNQGYIYVRKIIFDYKTSEGETKPSLIIKKILKNVKVYFDFDKSDLRDDALDALNRALWTLEHEPKTDILITGNTDVRGSEKYNEKLGERRALGVKQFLLDKNLPEDRIKILSRGKMDALAPTNDIEGMQKDRNAQFMIVEVEEVMIPASQAHLYQDKVIEEKESVEGAIKVNFKDYVIQPGDTLWKIAEREYGAGQGRQWKRIYEFNKDVIADPNKPKKGATIRIPIE